MNNYCSICCEIKGNWQSFRIEGYKEFIKTNTNVILSSKYFMIIPSIGALNKSHALIVPKFHVKSFSRIRKNNINELDNLKNELIKYYFKLTGKDLMFFEHGAGDRSESSGACIEHAHMHVIEEISSFKKKIMKDLTFKEIDNLLSLAKYSDNHFGYVLFEDLQGVLIKNNPMVMPQYFRKIYASSQKYPEVWDWSTNPNINNVKEVIEFYHGIKKLNKID